MKDFIYLVQGQHDLVKQHFHLDKRLNADALFLTYDESIEGATYFPNSTWAEGRNMLLNLAQSKGDYRYFIFCDDDTTFNKGGWNLFEKELISLNPAIAVPVVRKTASCTIKALRHQTFLINDEQLVAFHKDVVSDALVLPYQTKFDDLHWWASCEIQEILIQNFYGSTALQFNNIEINNDCNERYESPENGKEAFRGVVRAWLSGEFNQKFRDIKNYISKRSLIKIFWNSLAFKLYGSKHSKKAGHKLTPEKLRFMLNENATLLKQCTNQQ